MSLHISQDDDSFSITDESNLLLVPSIFHLTLERDSKNEQSFLNCLHKLLSSSKFRLQALQAINSVIDSCSVDVISENAFIWLQYCLVQYSSDNLKEIKLRTIGKIVDNAHAKDDFTKKFLSDYINKVLDSCLLPHLNPHETEVALKTLSICMKHYPSWFTFHKPKIETFLLKFLENSSDKLVELAAEAFLLLQQVGNGGTDGINHKQNFSSTFHKLCVTVHKLFDTFFEGQTEVELNDTAAEAGYAFSNLSYDSEKMIQVTVRRIRNSLKFIKVMFLKAFPVVKEIKPIEILNLINRGTALHMCLSVEDKRAMKDFHFAFQLVNTQILLIQLLRVLIIWFQTSSLPFGYQISKILIDSLNRSQKCDCFKIHCQFQETVYKVLNCWITVSKCSIHEHFQTQLISCILKDITPTKSEITLTVSTDSQNKSKKSRKKAVQDRVVSSGQTSRVRPMTERTHQAKTCSAALDTLKHILVYSYLMVNQNKLQELYAWVFDIVMEISTSDFAEPYTNPSCQAKVYEVLVAFYEQDTLSVLPQLQLSLDILNKGVNSNNRNISLVCENGLRILEKLCQPVCPSLYVPNKVEPEKTPIRTTPARADGVESKGGVNYKDREISGEEVLLNKVSDYEYLNAETDEPVTETAIANQVGDEGEAEEAEIDPDEVDVERIDDQAINNFISSLGPDLAKNTSINILDVTILGHANNGQQSSQDSNQEISVQQAIDSTDALQTAELVEDSNVLKQEILSSDNIEQSSSAGETVSAEPNEDEPPRKMSRLEIKEELATPEPQSSEEQAGTLGADDDDDAFVDEVKDY